MQLSTLEQTNSLSLLNLFHNFKGGLLLLCIVLLLNVGNKSYGRKVAVEVGGKKGTKIKVKIVYRQILFGSSAERSLH